LGASARPQSLPKSPSASALQVSESTTSENRGSTAHKLFVGSENRSALIMQFQLFAGAAADGFLGNK
jgi:hypothetical protein